MKYHVRKRYGRWQLFPDDRDAIAIFTSEKLEDIWRFLKFRSLREKLRGAH